MARVAGARYTRFMARILDIADAKARGAALDALAAGDCVAIPTETVYGLAADATNGRAVAKIFAMKGRPGFNPLICHVSDIGMAREHGELAVAAERLAEAFWPGPLTLVVPRRPGSAIHDLCTAGLDTVGLRCPDGFSRELIAGFGRPLAAPSANRSGRISTTSAQHVAEEYPGETLIVLDAGPCRVGLESTIVQVGDDRLTLLRLTEQVGQIAERLDKLDSAQGWGKREGGGAFRFESPGDAWLAPARDNERELIRKPRPPLPDARLVRQVIAKRQARAKFFDAELFADPAWDMLLDLTAARVERKRVSVTSLCIASAVPPTTALRWIGQMVEAGLFIRVEDDTDRRRAFIDLSDNAVDAMARYFADVGEDALLAA